MTAYSGFPNSILHPVVNFPDVYPVRVLRDELLHVLLGHVSLDELIGVCLDEAPQFRFTRGGVVGIDMLVIDRLTLAPQFSKPGFELPLNLRFHLLPRVITHAAITA